MHMNLSKLQERVKDGESGVPPSIGLQRDTTEPTAVTSNTLGTKVGQAEALSVLGVAAVGDAGIEKAAKQAGIKKISHVDKKTFSVLGLFTKVTYTVYGE